jgi:hypothetical protein
MKRIAVLSRATISGMDGSMDLLIFGLIGYNIIILDLIISN